MMMKMKVINYVYIVYLTNHYIVWCVLIILRSHVWIIVWLDFFVCSIPKGPGDSISHTGYLISGACPSFPLKKKEKIYKCASLLLVRWNDGETPADLRPDRYICSHSPVAPIILSFLKKYFIFVHILDLIKLLLAMISTYRLLLTSGIS
jgi:hypothetical protein